MSEAFLLGIGWGFLAGALTLDLVWRKVNRMRDHLDELRKNQ